MIPRTMDYGMLWVYFAANVETLITSAQIPYKTCSRTWQDESQHVLQPSHPDFLLRVFILFAKLRAIRVAFHPRNLWPRAGSWHLHTLNLGSLGSCSVQGVAWVFGRFSDRSVSSDLIP